MIALRKSSEVLRTGDFTLLLPEDPQLFAYSRSLGEEKILVCCNFSDREVDFPFPEGEILLSDSLNGSTLAAYGFAVARANSGDKKILPKSVTVVDTISTTVIFYLFPFLRCFWYETGDIPNNSGHKQIVCPDLMRPWSEKTGLGTL